MLWKIENPNIAQANKGRIRELFLAGKRNRKREVEEQNEVINKNNKKHNEKTKQYYADMNTYLDKHNAEVLISFSFLFFLTILFHYYLVSLSLLFYQYHFSLSDGFTIPLSFLSVYLLLERKTC